MSSLRLNSQCVLSSLLFLATSKSFTMQNSTRNKGVCPCRALERQVSICAFSPHFLGPGDQWVRPGGRDLLQWAWLWAGESQRSERSVLAGKTSTGLFHACPRCARVASRGRQRDRSGPRRSPALSRANPPRPRSEAPSPTDRPLGSVGCRVLPLPQVQTEPLGAMASPSGSPEDTGKLRGRDGRQRREQEDAPPEEKRLRLGLEGGSAAQEEGEDTSRLGREETGTQTAVEGRGVSEQGRRRDEAGGWQGCFPSVRRQVQVGNWAVTPAGGRGVTAVGTF